MDEEQNNPITIYYDGAYGICSREIERYRAKDKHAKDENGKVIYGVEAFAWIWVASGYRLPTIVVRLPLIRQLSRGFYRLFVRCRYKIWRGNLVCGSECDHKMI